MGRRSYVDVATVVPIHRKDHELGGGGVTPFTKAGLLVGGVGRLGRISTVAGVIMSSSSSLVLTVTSSRKMLARGHTPRFYSRGAGAFNRIITRVYRGIPNSSVL